MDRWSGWQTSCSQIRISEQEAALHYMFDVSSIVNPRGRHSATPRRQHWPATTTQEQHWQKSLWLPWSNFQTRGPQECCTPSQCSSPQNKGHNSVESGDSSMAERQNVIERSRVRIPAGVAEEFSSPGSTFCADSYFGIFPPTLCYHSSTWTIPVLLPKVQMAGYS